jgi:hypothetical protein
MYGELKDRNGLYMAGDARSVNGNASMTAAVLTDTIKIFPAVAIAAAAYL